MPRSVSWPETRTGVPSSIEASEREGLGERPVDPAVGAEHVAAALELGQQLGMNREVRRNDQELVVQRLEAVARNGGLGHVAADAAGLALLPPAHRALGDRLPQRVVRGLDLAVGLGEHRLDVALVHDAVVDQILGVQLANGRMVLDPLVHERLRVGRLVTLVVAEAPVADDVHDDVALELGAVGHRQADRGQRALGIVGVHVDDRRVEALGDVARVPRRALLVRVRREADLVVRDDVERAAGRVAVEPHEVQGLRDDPLAGEGRVPVDEERHRGGRIVAQLRLVEAGLQRARRPDDDRVDRLEVARVRREQHLDLAVLRQADALRAVVVLHVAGAALGVVRDRLERPLALELLEDHLVRTTERVGDDVQPAAVRHAEHDVLRAAGGGELERLVEHRDHHVEPRERERLLAEEHAAQVRLQALGLGEAVEKTLLRIVVERLPVAARLDRVAQPHALLVVRDVLDLVGHRPAVGRAELREDFEERVALAVETEEPRRDARLELRRQLRDQPVGIERGIAGRRGAERIEVRGEVAVHPVRLDERHRGGDSAEELLVDRGGLGGDRARRRRFRRRERAHGDAARPAGARPGQDWTRSTRATRAATDSGEFRYSTKSSWT